MRDTQTSNFSGYRGGATEHDLNVYRNPKPITEEQARESEVVNLVFCWQQTCANLKFNILYLPTADWLESKLRKYGFETCREAVLRGVKAFSKMGEVRGPENIDEAVHMLNYVNKVMKSLQFCKEHGGKERGEPLQRKGPERLYV